MDSSDSEFESALRKAEGIVAEAFMDAFPKHYMISQRIFSVPEDTEPFLRKLGRFLLDYDQELGASPAAALADGRSDLLLKVLANRSSIDPESIRVISMPIHDSTEEAERKPESIFLAYCNYYATGEGVTLMVGAGNTKSAARESFLSNAPEYFHRGLIEDKLDDSPPPETRRAARLLSDAMAELIASLPRGAPQFYAKIHYNLA